VLTNWLSAFWRLGVRSPKYLPENRTATLILSTGTPTRSGSASISFSPGLLRVVPGVYSTGPTDFAGLEQEERFSVFFPLGAALNRGKRTPRALYEVWNDTLLVERVGDVNWAPP
jgi:hypothetical protein